MKRFLIAITIAAATLTTSALAADVGVSVSVGQPGFLAASISAIIPIRSHA